MLLFFFYFDLFEMQLFVHAIQIVNLHSNVVEFKDLLFNMLLVQFMLFVNTCTDS